MFPDSFSKHEVSYSTLVPDTNLKPNLCNRPEWNHIQNQN